MVGFGSSLRMARRPGWEEAYLNYEALKLLLTQIEAVYEEEAHLQHQRRQNGGDGLGDDGLDLDLRDLDVMFVETPDRRGRRRDHQNHAQQQQRQQPKSEGSEKRTRDYRDELFLESDSDAAFESLMKYDAYSAEEAASDLEQQQQQIEFEQQLASLHNMQQQQSLQQQQSPRGARASNSMAGHSNNFDRQDHSNAPGQPQNAFASHDNYDNNFDGRHNGEYDSDDTSQGDYDNKCVPSFGRRKKTSKQSNKNTQHHLRPNPNPHPYHRSNQNAGRGASFLSPAGGKSKPDAFILDNNDEDDDDDDDDDVNRYTQNNDEQGYTQFDTTGMTTLTSFGQTIQTRQIPFGRNSNTDEMAPLLTGPTTPGSVDSPRYSFGTGVGPVTPPPVDSFLRTRGDPTSLLQMPNIDDDREHSNHNASLKPAAVVKNVSAPSFSMSNKTQMIKQLEEERKQERRKRRQKKRQRAERRQALERKVPRHIRCAHTKAREITQRFLGLLRAECEKVMLFAQSRLGELADTAGSLRFPAMEDHHHHHHQNNHGVNSSSSLHQHGLTSHGSGIYETAPLSPSGSATAAASRGTVGSYDYPLSEGGMHPSASSSSDDGLGGSDWFDWSESSSDSVDSNNSGSPRMARSLSAFRDNMQEGRQPLYDHDRRRSKAKSVGDSQRHHESSSPNKRHDGFTSAKRHLDHFEKMRRSRPIFQRNGNIMGEDLLLLSAVDEADGYTAVGVELMHVLRFISVNLIAVRKICRKHDRLLMNRMLGGYYQHLKMLAVSESNNLLRSQEIRDNGGTKNRQQAYQDAHVQNAQALGGILARESGDIFETHHPAVIGQVNNYKLVGLYDANLQQLANSRTVQVISSCLVLALSEYEVSRSRANALATLNTHSSIPLRPGNSKAQTIFRLDRQHNQPGTNPHAQMKTLSEGNEAGAADSDEEGGPPSTASSISLTRLRFAVTSIIALREAARRKKNFYFTYLSRSMLAFTGRAVVGEGLDGCSRETLDFFVDYNPDAALLMDPVSLNDGLKQGMWSKRSISSVMASSLAVATIPVDLPDDLIAKSLYQQERKVKRAVNLLPSVKMIEVPELFKGHRAKKSTSALAILESDCFRSILRLNRASHFLYTMNYFIVHPTTITFITAIGSPGAHSALVIGAPSVSALLSALLHCYILSGGSKATMASVSSLRWLFLIAACFGVAGNAGHVYGVWENSISYAILGRFIMGFSCSEILNRNIVAGFLPVHGVVTETAILVQVQVLGMLMGLIIGTLAEFLSFHVAGWSTQSLSSSSWLMGLLWFIHLIHVCICFRVEDRDAQRRLEANNAAEVEQLLTQQKVSLSINYDSDSSGSLQGKRSNSSHNIHASLRLTYGATDDIDIKLDESNDAIDPPAATTARKKTQQQGKGRKRRMRTLRSFPARLRRLLNYSIGVPVCLFILLYIKFALEVMISSCPMILDRYFRWGGGRAGIFLAGLTLMILPVNFICGHIARKHEERTVLKKSLLVLGTGLVVMINYGSFLELAFQIRELLSETEDKQRGSQYDWLVGIIQYFVGFAVTFFGLTALDSAALSLLSKVSPPRLRTSSASLQLGTIVSFVTLFARIIADFQILMIGLSHRLINTDLVNSLVLPLLVGCFVIGHFVRKHFFFLM